MTPDAVENTAGRYTVPSLDSTVTLNYKLILGP